jgi:hypothetical protein
MNPLGVRNDYVRARRTLIATLRHLDIYRKDAIVVVGAQAVYLRTQTATLPFAPFTLDSDLAIDPRVLEREPPIRHTLARLGYTRRDGQPGLYWAPESNGEDGAQVDVLVPEEFASGHSRRDANLPGDNAGAARRTPGLEPALYDRDILRIAELDDACSGIEAFVAGPAAMIVAKARKVFERDSAAPHRVKAKDVTDVFALLRAHEPDDLARRFERLARAPEIHDSLALGLAAVRAVFGGVRGHALFLQALEESDERAELLESYGILTDELIAVVNEFAK